MTLLAAFSVLLGRYCGQDDVVVGTPVAGRNRAETEDLIGFFVNTLVMRTDLSGDPTFAEVLGRVRETALGAYAHQDLPFEQLVDALVTERDRSRTPLFQVLMDYYRQDAPDSGGGGGELAEVPAKFDVRLIVVDGGGGGLAGRIEYATGLFDAATAGRMAGHLVTLLAGVAADPGRALSRLPVLTAAERAELVTGRNGTAVTWPAVAGLPAGAAPGVADLFAARAGVAPDAVAVADGGRQVTYAGLRVRAGRLARYLRGAGVGPETVVALCLPRGADMVSRGACGVAGRGRLPAA